LEKVPQFWGYSIPLKTVHMISRPRVTGQNLQLNSLSRFDRTPDCDRRTDARPQHMAAALCICVAFVLR